MKYQIGGKRLFFSLFFIIIKETAGLLRRREHVNFTQIHYFITVAKTLSFTKAAEMLYITQPAISRHINTMEEELGFPLFTRNKRKLQLTPEGRILAEELDKVFFSYNAAVRKAKRGSDTNAGAITVGIVDGLDIDEPLAKTLRTLQKEYPALDIALFNFGYEELGARLQDGKLDVGFSRAYDVEHRGYLKSRFVMKNRDILVVSKDNPLSQKEFVDFSDLWDQTIILVSETDDDINRKMVQAKCAACGYVPDIKYSPSYHINYVWVKSNMGVFIQDERAIIPPRGVVQIPFESYRNTDVLLVWSEHNTNPARRIFEEVFARVNGLEDN